MSANTDIAYEKFLKDNKYPELSIGDEYYWKGTQYTYREDLIPVIEIAEAYPYAMHANNCLKIVDRLEPDRLQSINEQIRLALDAQARKNANTVANMQKTPKPGLDFYVEAVKKVIDLVQKQVPGKSGAASSIISKISTVNTLMNTALKGPGSTIFSAITSNLMKGIDSDNGGSSGIASSNNVISLQTEVIQLVAVANNKPAYAKQHARIANNFPQVDVNNIARMATNAVKNKQPSALMQALPLLMTGASIGLKMLGAASKHPDKLPQPEKKTPPAEKPKKLIEPKNLFSSSAGGSSMGTLMGSVGSLMQIASTITNNLNQMKTSAALTSGGTQKLTATANTTAWGSGQYAKVISIYDENMKKQLELLEKIEELQADISASADLEKITSKTEAELRAIYPQLNESTTVVELLDAIEAYEKQQIESTIKQQFS